MTYPGMVLRRLTPSPGLILLVIGALVSGAVPTGARHHDHGGAGGHHHSPLVGGPETTRQTDAEPPPATPGIACDAGSRPEKVQGKVPARDYESGRAARGYFCNARGIAHVGDSGGYRVERYVDRHGNECAYWDSTLLWPHNIPNQGTAGPGVYVMDMKNPAKPRVTAILQTPAMQSPHESLRLNHKRGLLVAAWANPEAFPGMLDVYDVTEDCRKPALLSSTPMGVLGHESGFAPDGKTFYVTSLYEHTLTAVDLTNPMAPVVLWASTDYQPHGVSISNDGNRLYMAEAAREDSGEAFHGLTILDVSEIQDRILNPTVRLVTRLTWPEVGTPQNATPFTRDGHGYLLQTDEFGSGNNVGAARIIDISNEKKPKVVSHLRLEVNNNGETTEDPGDNLPYQGYQAHYCTLPGRIDPNIVACSFIMSGLRVFDIRDPANPREIAYFNQPRMPGTDFYPIKAGAFAMAAPAYDQETRDIWYTDGNTGFHVVRLTERSGVTRFADRILYPGS